MSILVIGEKPSVSRELAKVLGANTKKNGCLEGNDYVVSWCFGHLVGLQFPDEYSENWAAKWSFAQLPMIPEEWKFKISENSKDQFKVLKQLMNDRNIMEIICATDADREGECIFRYVYNLVKCQKLVKRLWISSLEESAIRDGFHKLKNSSAYDNLYQAGFCRAKADWLVGMNGSRLFSVRYNAHLNTGRVQTPTLAMIVKRDADIATFVKQKYFTVVLDMGFPAESARIDEEHTADMLASSCNGKTVTVTDVKKEVKSISAPKLFDLTFLQREANKSSVTRHSRPSTICSPSMKRSWSPIPVPILSIYPMIWNRPPMLSFLRSVNTLGSEWLPNRISKRSSTTVRSQGIMQSFQPKAV